MMQEKAQIEIARSVIRRFELSTGVLAFDTTNFDTHIATTTPGELARRGHTKSKRRDLRVVGLATLVSETGCRTEMCASVADAVLWCATAVRGVNNWNSTWMSPVTTR